MAETVAAAVAAEQVVSTTAQVGIGGYMLAKPTMPLKATFRQLSSSSDGTDRKALARADHSLSVVGESTAYIFGGETINGLATNDIYAISLENHERRVLSPVPDTQGGPVPAARKKHCACAFNVCVAVFGGLDANDHVLEEEAVLWLFNTAKSTWELMQSENGGEAPAPRYGARLFDHQNNLVLYGGHGADGEVLRDVWLFDYAAKTWHRLPDSPVATPSAVVADSVLYTIIGNDNMSSDLHYLQLPPHDAKQAREAAWQTVEFPTNPLAPGPRPRMGAGLSHISTGQGRNYLAYFFGARQIGQAVPSSDEKPLGANETTSEDPLYWSDIWTYQIPSSEHQLSAIKPARVKDSIRNMLGFDSGEHSWAEAEVLPPTDMDATAGKVHPGPRGYFGCDQMKDGRSLVVWGGINAKGEMEGDGWIVELQ